MSTSICYHLFHTYNYMYIKSEYTEDMFICHLKKKASKQKCVVCGSYSVVKKGKQLRYVQTVPVGFKRTFLALHLHRLYCKNCQSLRLESIDICLPKKRWTKALAQYVLKMVEISTIEDVAKHLCLSWNVVRDIHQMALEKKYRKRRYRNLRYLAVDEIAIRKGHSYMTVVIDLESGDVVWVCEGRKTDSFGAFLIKLKRSGAKVKAIAMDMWAPYSDAVFKYYPGADIVFDRYHIMAAMNRVIDEIRRKQFTQAPKQYKAIYKGTRYLLLQNHEKLIHHTQARDKLYRLLNLNTALFTAYVLKEELRALWNCQSYDEAKIMLRNWIEKCFASAIPKLMIFSNSIACHRYGILNYFKHRITTAQIEGTNNKIKVLKRKAYGYRNMKYFKLRILFIKNTRYALL